MFPLLLISLVSTVLAINLIETWDCGPQDSKGLMILAEATLFTCPIVKDSFNMCCKDHDYCYETHLSNHYGKEFCDARFCACLHDAEDVNNKNACALHLQRMAACAAVKGNIGEMIYLKSKPHDTSEKFKDFEDTNPLGLDMKKLVNTCEHAKGMAVHCHNSVYRCIEQRKERETSGGLAKHSHEDCESIMYECLQIIGDTKDKEPCPSLARSMATQLTAALDASRYGKATIEIYPKISERLIKDCENKEAIELCLKSFDSCADNPKNREEHQELFKAATRVKIVCHRELRKCIDHATGEVGIASDACFEARHMALSRIREQQYEDMTAAKEALTRINDYFHDHVHIFNK